MKGAIRRRGQKEEKKEGMTEIARLEARTSHSASAMREQRAKKQRAPKAQPKRVTTKRQMTSAASPAMAHETGENQKGKRGIARREARTIHSTSGEEGGGWGGRGEGTR